MKRSALRALIERSEIKNAIVFCNRKTEVDIVAKSLARHGLDASPIHGDLDQSQRTKTLERFRGGELAILVASDVAARGLDIPAVSHVFNYDVPHHAEDYVHRIGRTGRAGRTGETFMIVTPADAKGYDKVLKLIKQEPQTVPLDLDWGRLEEQGREDGARRKRPERGGAARSGASRGGRDRGDRDPSPRPPRSEASEPAVEAPDAQAQVATPPEPVEDRPARRRRSERAPRPERDTQDQPLRAERPARDRAPSPERLEPERAPRYGGDTRSGAAVREAREPAEPRGGDRERAGFGADTPAFLLRATPLPAKAKEPAEIDA